MPSPGRRPYRRGVVTAVLVTVLALVGACGNSPAVGSNAPSHSTSAQPAASAGGPNASGTDPGAAGSTNGSTSNPTASVAPATNTDTELPVASGPSKPAVTLYPVKGIVDGDTIKVQIGGNSETVRLIGIDTPELHKPGYAPQCYAQAAASRVQSLIQGKQVQLRSDPTQDDRDRYGRLLRHVLLTDGRSLALILLQGGFGREYTYDRAYAGQADYRSAEAAARASGSGLWSACDGFPALVSLTTGARPSTAPTRPPAAPTTAPPPPAPPASATPGRCLIKGNINSKGEKIYHVPGSRSYDATKINTAKGERWFCTETEALAAGWRAPRG